MSRSLLRTWLALVALVAVFGLGACGGGDDETGADGGTPAQSDTAGGGNVTEQLFAGSAADNRQDPAQGKKGGKLTVLSAGDVDYMDPGTTYYTYAIGIMNAMHRGLYAYLPGSTEQPVPDLADGDPQISNDGKTVTVKLKQGIMFSRPVNREVTSADVKYAIERAYTENVLGPYVRAYFGDVVGAPPEPGPYQEVEGLQTPDDQTLVIKLTKGTGAAAAGALAMPISTPVPKEYARKFDRQPESTYFQHQVFTGPYKLETNADGTDVTGYVPGKRIHLVRNPDYKPVDDFRPAYLDEIDIQAGNDDTAVATRRILSGESMASGEIEPPANQLRRLLESNKTELSVVPGGGWRMISMDTSRPPFNDINVRKAVIAGFNRVAARQQRGGEALGPIAQHYIPPGMSGFDESGGLEPDPKFDWMQKPEGDRTLSAEYFKKAGMQSGKYEGNADVLIVADNAEPERSIAQITDQQLKEMGFNTTLRLVTRDTMFTRFCNASDSEVNVCPSVGWAQDFADPQTMLDPTFNGNNILKSGNSNWPELDVPELNREIEQAKLVTDPDERAQAWAKVNLDVVAQAPAIPYMWDYQAVVASPNVRGVQSGYSTTWDWNFTSLR
jgi:peptide/nickel transport system substrate-binding protein